MVAKISSNSSLFGTINYNKLKVEDDKAKVLFSRNIFEKRDGSFSMSLCQKSFEPYLAVNKRTENPIFHVSLNPDPKDRLDDEQLSEIAEKYMEAMGYSNQPFIVFKHTDIERTHLHVVSCRVDETGKKLDSNFENIRSMKICRNLEQEYNLKIAEKKEQTNEIPTGKVNYQRGDVKHQVFNAVKALMNNYHFQSFGEFRTLLEQMNVTVEEVRGTASNGQRYDGIVYSATDDKGKRLGIPFKSSLFGKEVGYEALQKKFEKSNQAVKEKKIREQLIPIIRAVMKTAGSKERLELLLKEKNIQPIFRQNEQRRIYGVTFIDHNSRTVINGSRLGKEFAANQFQELFNNPMARTDYKETEQIQSQGKGNDLNPLDYLAKPIESVGSAVESVVGGLFGLLPTEKDNQEEYPRYPKIPKKIRRRYGRQL
ncbi:Relaxase/mobilization nuclease domain protein [Bacteroidales bacterium Barb6XT]|nr:Relaxase/mobilization nuclease domain protein [Bacteroidales bacterium Barb6XT]